MKLAQGMHLLSENMHTKVSGTFVGSSFGLLVVTVPPTPKFTYENHAFSTLTNCNSQKNFKEWQLVKVEKA